MSLRKTQHWYYKGMIRLSMVKFPKGTRGVQLDTLQGYRYGWRVKITITEPDMVSETL